MPGLRLGLLSHRPALEGHRASASFPRCPIRFHAGGLMKFSHALADAFNPRGAMKKIGAEGNSTEVAALKTQDN